MSAPVIEYDYLSGKCPVQAEGRINGHPFYFRARGGRWSLTINSRKDDPVDYLAWSIPKENCWRKALPYDGVNAHRDDEINDGRRFSAGWAEPDECRAFIAKMAAQWVEECRA